MDCDKPLHARTTELTALSRHLFQVAEEEKAGLARALHDVLGSNLTAINMDLNWIAKRLPPDRPELGERLQRVLRNLGQTVEWKQQIIDRLRPSHLDTLGLAEAIRSQCQELALRTGRTCEIDVLEDFDDLDGVSLIALFRVAAAALANMEKNAGTALRVQMRREASGVRMLISGDGGAGGNTHEAAMNIELIEMRERMRALGGTLTLNGSENGGTVVDAYLPMSS